MSGPFNQFAKDRLNSSSQPNPRFWANRDVFGQWYAELGPGDYNLLHDKSRGMGSNDIDAIYVPPNYEIVANSNGNDESRGAKAVFNGTSSNTGEPGVYWNFDRNVYGVGPDDIDVLHIRERTDIDETDPDGKRTVPYTWDRFKRKCCIGALPASQCGIHVQGVAGNDCSTVFKNCTGTDLKIPYGSSPSYRSQYCSAMASANPAIGDNIKQQYCISNPTDPFCSCMKLTGTADYIRWAQAMNAKHPEIVVSPLMYMDAGGNNPCRKHLTTDMQTQFIPSELIEQIGHLPTSYTISDLTVSGDNNNLSNVSSNVTPNPPKPPVTPKPPADPAKDPPKDVPADPAKDPTDTSEPNPYTNYIIIAFVIIVAAACYWAFTDTVPKPNYVQRPYAQPYPQQYPLNQFNQQPYQTVTR